MIQHDGKIKTSKMFTVQDPGELKMVLGFINYLLNPDQTINNTHCNPYNGDATATIDVQGI